jgi:endogenous inhibitor of DNA gyrase (YacG/DUF329 family)
MFGTADYRLQSTVLSCYLCAMTDKAGTCPYCGEEVPRDVVCEYRPFSCPKCQSIVVVRGAYGKYMLPGCVLFFLFIAAALYIFEANLSRGPFRVLGVVAAAVGAISIMRGILWLLNHWRPRPEILEKHVLCEHPDLVPQVADFLDSVADLQVWSDEKDRRLSLLERETSHWFQRR